VSQIPNEEPGFYDGPPDDLEPDTEVEPHRPHLVAVESTSPNLPADFYAERPELAHIRQAAHSTTMSPDALLGVVLARVATLVPPTLRLPAPVGRPGTLDLMVATIGNSGTGKSASAEVGGALVPFDDDAIAELGLGSGEGLIEGYLDWVMEEDPTDPSKKRRVKRQVKRGVLASLDEGQALNEYRNRRGNITLTTCRTAWSGGRLGQANASDERNRQIAPGEYRFALLAGFQLEHATALLDDAAGGTPQRFLFVAAEDPTIPDEPVDWPGPLPWRLPQHQAGPMGLPAAVAAEIRTRKLQRTRGAVAIDPLDSHRDLSRLKVAGLLSVLAQRADIDVDDWRLAGDVLDASDRVRTSIIHAAQWRAREAERSQTAKLVRQGAAIDDGATERALASMAKAVARHVHRGACEGPCGRSCVMRSTAGKHRKFATLDEALDEARRHGWIAFDGDHITPGPEQP